MTDSPRNTEEFLKQLEKDQHPDIQSLNTMFERILSDIHPRKLDATRIQFEEESGVERWSLKFKDFEIRIIRRNNKNQIDRINDTFFL